MFNYEYQVVDNSVIWDCFKDNFSVDKLIYLMESKDGFIRVRSFHNDADDYSGYIDNNYLTKEEFKILTGSEIPSENYLRTVMLRNKY